MTAMLKLFFSNLSDLRKTENDLSDVTWAIARTCPDILHAFLQLFDISTKDAVWDITREYVLKDGSRPDFMIRSGTLEVLIENKLYDRSYHFEQYNEATDGKVELCLITNHRLEKKDLQCAKENHFNVKTWKEFIDKLSARSFEERWREIVEAYIVYLKEVCSMVETKKVCFDSFSGLYNFNLLVREVLSETKHPEVDLKWYQTPPRARGNCWMTEYFSFKKVGKKDTVYPCLGIYFEKEAPSIYVSFESDWSKSVYDKMRTASFKGLKLSSFKKNEKDGELFFDMTEEQLDKFKDKSSDLNRQKEILSDFLREVIDAVGKYL